MPATPMAPQTAAPAGRPQPGQASPMGQSSATQPSSNRGSEAQALQQVAAGMKFIEAAVHGVGAASEMGQKLSKVLSDLIKLTPAGSTTPAGEKNAMQNQAMQNAQQNRAAMQMRQQAMQGQGGQGAQGAQPGAAE